LKELSANFPYLEIKELISYYAVFDGFKELERLHNYDNLLQNIEENILKKYKDLKSLFIYSDDLKMQRDMEKMLFRICVGDAKTYCAFKNGISPNYGFTLYKILFEKKIIKKELSREKPLRVFAKQQIKKEFRGYHIEDKIRFCKNFYRFWFTFIAPNSSLLEAGDFSGVILKIEKDLNRYISFIFETLSNELILKKFECVESGSYWDKKVELDLFCKTSKGKIIAGECKWKNQKISKNILNKLQKKSNLAGLKVDIFALFSKNGFSNELLKHSDENIQLYDLDSFKELLYA